MALINNLYIHVTSESVSYGSEISSHPIETGGEITDHMQKKSFELSISGKIVNVNDKKASNILSELKTLQAKGSLITYVGRNILYNMQISSFSTSHPNTVWGGCEFSMTLKEVKIAKPAYVSPTEETGVQNAGTQKVEVGNENKVYHTVKKGDTCWSLVYKNYKDLVFYDDGEPIPNQSIKDKCNEIMAQNPHAFSRKGDFGTLIIGAKIFVGFRK